MGRHHRQSGPTRRPATRKRRRYLIVSEDSKSSLDYLSAFPVDRSLVEIVREGGAGNTVAVVTRGIELQKEATSAGQPFIHVYCVFDKDDWEISRYQSAFIEAGKHNDITAIWANECFELWYLLHFSYHNSGIGRDLIYKKLETADRLGKDYQKGDTSIYEMLRSQREAALRNADKLLVSARDESPTQPWMINPSTNVQIVVRKLIGLGELVRA
jgi:hypothetical protein